MNSLTSNRLSLCWPAQGAIGCAASDMVSDTVTDMASDTDGKTSSKTAYDTAILQMIPFVIRYRILASKWM